MSSIEELESKLKQVRKGDFYRFRQQLRRIKTASKQGQPFDRNLARLSDSMEKSIRNLEQRQKHLPKIPYDSELPVLDKKREIIQAIEENQVVIVCGETGSGKSTQLPKFCLEMGRGIHGMIGHTQPRRIAARSVASRIADELGSSVGTDVGFKIRFHDRIQERTYIKLMTDGILLAESERDPFLNQYDTIIIDEAHERSLNIDFLLGYLHRILKKRNDLRVVITSATLDAGRFSEHFLLKGKPAPIIEVSGRTYPVDVCYRPVEKQEGEREPDVYSAITDAVDEAASIDQGDILIFMPTERDIREVSRKLKGHPIPGDSGKKTSVIPLYGRLSIKEQNRVFQTESFRRIVIATNVAESSLTVPGIRYVIDTGTARISRFSARSQVQRLPIEAISRASADQRKGRCGRVGPGICYRLYSEEDYLNREEFTAPEILRTNLASVILKCISLNLGPIEQFPFLEPPKPAAIRTGYKTLFELGAIDENNKLTNIGKKLSRMPVDPRIGRMILAGEEEHCLSEVLIIASVLELQDPRERPVDQQEKADQAHEKFVDEDSDFLTLLNLWDFYHEQKGNLSRNQLRKACMQNFLSHNRMREWGDIHHQLMEVCEEMGMKIVHAKRNPDAIHRALLTGLLSNVAFRGESFEYTGSGGQKLFLWPGSGVFEKKPKWIMAAELVETSKRYARVVTRIQPGWIEPAAKHLVKRSYSEPHWSREKSATMAFEKVTLFGMTIVPRRKVRFGPVDPVKSRELMIQDGLVEGEFDTKRPFFKHNQDLLAELESMKAKSRKGDFLLGEEARFEFYDQRIPKDVYDGHRLNRWDQQIASEYPRMLFMSKEDLLNETEEEVGEKDFPETIVINQMVLPLEYHLEPGSDKDGVTVLVPREGVAQIDSSRLDWLIPGLIEQKVTALLKSLPKSLRRMLVPIPDTTKEIMKELKYGEGDLKKSLVSAIRNITNEQISATDFDESRLPGHLRMNIRVLDSKGKEVDQGRNLKTIQGQNRMESGQQLEDSTEWHRDGLVEWDFKEFPESILMERNGIEIKAFPTLKDASVSVSLCLLYDQKESGEETLRGLRRLFYLKHRRKIMSQVDWFPQLDRIQLLASSLRGFQIKEELGLLIAERAFLPDQKIPRTESEFQALSKTGLNRISVAVQEMAEFLCPLFENYHRIRVELESLNLPAWKNVTDDLWDQLNSMIHPRFLTETPWVWLLQIPRYLSGMEFRLNKIREGGFQKDQKAFAQLKPYLEKERSKREELLQTHQTHSGLEQFRWMIEEYRISLFAQKLGTAFSISPRKLDDQWNRIDG